MKVLPVRGAMVAKKWPTNSKLPSPRLTDSVFLLGQDVQGDLLTFGPGRRHLRQEPSDIPSHFRVSIAFEHIVNDVPALLHCAAGCDERRLTRLRLIAVAMNIRIELRLDVGGRVALL